MYASWALRGHRWYIQRAHLHKCRASATVLSTWLLGIHGNVRLLLRFHLHRLGHSFFLQLYLLCPAVAHSTRPRNSPVDLNKIIIISPSNVIISADPPRRPLFSNENRPKPQKSIHLNNQISPVFFPKQNNDQKVDPFELWFNSNSNQMAGWMKNRWIRTCKSRRSRFRWSATTTGMGEGGEPGQQKTNRKTTLSISLFTCAVNFSIFFLSSR